MAATHSAFRPRPNPLWTCLKRTGYLAGYQDGFHGQDRGAGYDSPPDTYHDGFGHGRGDAGRTQETLPHV